MLKLKDELFYYAIAGASLGDLVWIAAEMTIPILELSIVTSLVISAISSISHDLEESIPLLLSFLVPFFTIQVLLSFWYLSSISNSLKLNFLSGYLLATSMLSSLAFSASFLLFSLIFRFAFEFLK
ncbi:MAG: hypothetical protein QXU23_03285 [Candidatus Korarchaeum sp.]